MGRLCDGTAADGPNFPLRCPRIVMYFSRCFLRWIGGTPTPPPCPIRPSSAPVQSQEVYDRYAKYLNGCVRLFREGYTNLGQFTLTKSP
jgi:hypothetical protein